MKNKNRMLRPHHLFVEKWPWAILLFLLLFILSGPAKADTDPKSLFTLGVQKFKEEKYQEAIDLFTELILISPDNARAYKNRGVALMNLKKFDFAIGDFEKALQLDPRLTGVYINMGALWHYKGDEDKAISYYDRAISQNPGSYVAYFNRSISKIALNRYDAAVVDLDRALEQNPGFQEALALRREIQGKIEKPVAAPAFTVQTGAFLINANALDMVAALKKKGFDVRIVTLRGAKHREWFLVRCGENLTREDAEKLQQDIKMRVEIQAVIRPMNRF